MDLLPAFSINACSNSWPIVDKQANAHKHEIIVQQIVHLKLLCLGLTI